MVTLSNTGKRDGSRGRKASDPIPAPVTAGRVAGLHLVSPDDQVKFQTFALPRQGNFLKGMEFKMTNLAFGKDRPVVRAHSLTTQLPQLLVPRSLLNQRLQVFSRVALITGALLCATQPLQAENLGKVRIASFSGVTGLVDYATKEISPAIKEVMFKRNLALFVISGSSPREKSCFASIGITEPDKDGRNPRIPAQLSSSYSTTTDNSWNASDCESEQFRNAFSEFNSTPLEKSLTNLDLVLSSGGTRTKEPEIDGRVTLHAQGISDKIALFEVIQAYEFSKAFDYRHVQTSVYATGAEFKDGTYYCVAYAGLTGNSPDNRNSRWPSFSEGYSRVQTGGDLEGCKQFVSEKAINALLSRPWTKNGLLKNFAAVREDSVPVPSPTQVALNKAKIDKPKKTKPTISTTKSSNYAVCTNECVNGNCLRKFANGRTERWQAPWVPIPVTNNWGWDTSTNSCGL